MKDMIPIIAIIINISLVTNSFKQIYGRPIKNIIEEIRHSLLFLACIPNPKYLIILNIINKNKML